MTRRNFVLCLFTLLVVAGCASTKVTNRDTIVSGQLPRPDHVLVYDFASSPADLPADSAFAGLFVEPSTPPSAEQIELGRKLGSQMSTKLVEGLRAMGLPAEAATKLSIPQLNDIVIRGCLFSVEEGSATKRVALGFGSGAAELQTAVEGLQMTAQGLRKLGSGETGTKSGKTPGTAATLAVFAATKNPVGLIVGTSKGLYDEKTGKSTIEGKVDQAAKEIATVLKQRLDEQNWSK